MQHLNETRVLGFRTPTSTPPHAEYYSHGIDILTNFVHIIRHKDRQPQLILRHYLKDVYVCHMDMMERRLPVFVFLFQLQNWLTFSI